MARLLRSHLPDGYFHLTARGVGGEHIFLEDLDRIEFLDLYDTVAKRFRWRRIGHCLMGTHYHLVIETKASQLPPGMQYHSYVVRNEAHLEAALSYALANPVRANMCLEIGDWPWSSVSV
jgi:putative transposase